MQKFCYLILVFTFSALATIQIPTVTITKQKKDIANQQIKTDILTTNISVKKNIFLHKKLSEIFDQNTNISSEQTTGSGSSTVLHFRGFGDNASPNTLILINGQPFKNPDLGIPNFNFLSSQEIDSIQISENSQSVLYGDQATAGIVNFVTHIPQKNKTLLNLNYGSFNTYRANLLINRKIKNTPWSYSVNFEHYLSQHYRDHNDERNDYGGLSFNYLTDKTQANIALYLNHQFLQLPGALTQQQLDQNRRQANNNADDTQSMGSELLLNLTHELSEFWKLHLSSSAYFNRGNGTVSAVNTPYPFNNRRHSFFIRPDLTGLLNIRQASIFPTFGLSFQQAQYQYDSSTYASEDKQIQGAAFGEFKIPLTLKLKMVAGGRWAFSQNELTYNSTHTKNFNHVTIGSLGFYDQLKTHWSLYVRAANNYRFPKVDEETAAVNNQPLKTQTGIAYETGIRYQKNSNSFKVDLYQINLHNEIAYIPPINPSIQPFGYNENLNRTRRLGLSINAVRKINAHWQINTGARYVQPRLLSGVYAGKAIPDVPDYTFYLGNTLTINDHWRLFFSMKGIGPSYANNDYHNTARIPYYNVFNAAISFETKKFNATLYLNNLTNEKYSESAILQSGTSTLYYYPAPGINFMLNIGFKFN